jgi:hypothetical protein
VEVVLPKVTPLEANLTYPEHPIKVMDQKDCVTRQKMIKFYKVQWSNHTEEQAMWKSEDFHHSYHSDFVFHSEGTCDCSLSLLEPFSFTNLRLRFLLRGEGCDTPSVTVASTMTL